MIKYEGKITIKWAEILLIHLKMWNESIFIYHKK
jgi:hypothetical protein